MIEVRDVVHYYGVRPVLRGISLTVEVGELLVVLGPNGMGKSTLLAVIGGALAPIRGTVSVGGRCRRGSVADELAIRRTTVYLPDHPWLPGNRTGREFLFSVGRLYDVDDERLVEHIERLLDLFELAKQADSPIRSYSAGQKKKIAICSALVTEARVLLLDEPFSGGLDPSGLLALKRILQWHARRKEITIVLTSPVPELVEEIASRVAILHEGQIIASDTIAGLQRMTGCDGPLGDVLERLIYPETSERLGKYFQGLRQ
jgi:ABC-2 type transport system ATP-binding protein